MDHAGAVRGGECARDLRRDVQRAHHLDDALLRDQLREGFSLEVLHDVEVVALGRHPEVVDLHDVLVVDPRHRLRLLEEALDDLLVARELAVDDLERDLLADQRVLGEVHRTHSAGPDLVQDAVAADRMAGADQAGLIVAHRRGAAQNWS